MPQVSRTRLLARVVKAWWRRFNKRMNSTATDVPGLENVDRVHWLKAEDGARLRVFEVAAGTKTPRGSQPHLERCCDYCVCARVYP